MQIRFRALAALIVAVLALALPAPAARAYEPDEPFYLHTWQRTDKPVADGEVSRTWMWGPEANTPVGLESYAEGPGGYRTVQYFDKSRMEITDPAGDGDSPWFVTNGLLVVEMVTGRLQLGDDTFVDLEPAVVNVAGDADDPSGPTYETFSHVLDAPAAALNTPVVERIDRDAHVTTDASLAARGVTFSMRDDVTHHAVASVFWDFMTSTGLVWDDGEYVEDDLFLNPFYATGRPISEPYWANVKVADTYRDVLMQCFERRCLTYTPENPPGWQVEAGNVGQHYYMWRYRHTGSPPWMGMTLYMSSYQNWAEWPTGSPRADQPWLLGSTVGSTSKDGSIYRVSVPGGANTWVAARSELNDYANIYASVDLRLVDGVTGDIGCLLARLNGEGSLAEAEEYRTYALCMDASGALVAYYYELTPEGQTSIWAIPPGTASVDGPATDFHRLRIVAFGHYVWLVADGEPYGPFYHEGPLEGAVGVGVQRFNPDPGPAVFEFQNLLIALEHA